MEDNSHDPSDCLAREYHREFGENGDDYHLRRRLSKRDCGLQLHKRYWFG
ncbi:hypothetical protein VCR5J5_1430092 [Vibrio crassostreae]|uniref:Uncharacterized protein n=1 Tax=Vibrio crassostreae TaxID=246167 RepID=A0A822MTR4_9VIBR|nr:hypothetical protein VCR5J5_1430092 [Vibrio crassostreae]